MNLRPSTILWMVLWVIAAFGLYMVKYKVQAIKVEVAATEKQLREENRNLRVLTAEWTYLNRPERLQLLTAKYLDTKPTHGTQLADFDTFSYNKSVAGADQAPDPQLSEDEEGIVDKGLTLASGAAHDR